MSIDFDYKPKLNSDGTIAFPNADVAKHMGPGPHPSGSDQTVHAPGGGSAPSKKHEIKIYDPQPYTEDIRDQDASELGNAIFDASITIDGKLYQAEVFDSDWGDNAPHNELVVSGQIFGPDNEPVGKFQRHLDFESGDVYHSAFYLEEEWQGKGIGTSFIAHWEDEYIAAGFQRVSVTADEMGKYAWAMSGFEWDEMAAGNAMDTLRRTLAGTAEFHKPEVDFGELSTGERAAAEAMLAQHDQGIFVPVREVATLGYGMRDGDHIGKTLLLNNWMWEGTKELERIKKADAYDLAILWRQWAKDNPVAIETDDPEWMEAVIALNNPISKHMGPGRHPSGSTQQVHGGDHIPVTEGSSRGQPQTLLDADGNEIANSYDDLGNTANVAARYVDTVQERMMDQLEKYGGSPRELKTNMQRLMKSAMARYKDHPELLEADRFYERWHESLFELHQETGLPFDDLVASAAVMSPGMRADFNLYFAHDIARWVEENPTWEGRDVSHIRKILKKAGDDIFEPYYNEHHFEVIRGEKQIGDPRELPKEGGDRWLLGKRLQAQAKALQGVDSVSLSELDPDSAARVLAWERKRNGAPEGGLLGAIADDYTRAPRGGFPASKGYDNFAKAIDVARNTATPSEVLGDVKIRSFYNNILDPEDLAGRRDVTIDYHTINYSLFSTNADKVTAVHSTPNLGGVKLGIRPIVADVLRDVADEYNMLPLRAQEIMWAEWRRGILASRLVEGGAGWEDLEELNAKQHVAWRSYTGEVFKLDRLVADEDK